MIYISPSGKQFEILPVERWQEATHWLYPKYSSLKALEPGHLNRSENYASAIISRKPTA